MDPKRRARSEIFKEVYGTEAVKYRPSVTYPRLSLKNRLK